ncbi:MAG: hypothetical protein KBS86_02040 [Proteobacteria bacterium]|nr:hypothetical protein [Candidatus Enterousia scatequi]
MFFRNTNKKSSEIKFVRKIINDAVYTEWLTGRKCCFCMPNGTDVATMFFGDDYIRVTYENRSFCDELSTSLYTIRCDEAQLNSLYQYAKSSNSKHLDIISRIKQFIR